MAAKPTKTCKRKLWSQQSMEEAVRSVAADMPLREAARKYNVPVETLRRRVNGSVSIDCKPGPPTIFTSEEEDQIFEYLVSMADMGYGLTREMTMRIAYVLAEKLQKKHSFKDEKAGRFWFEGFRKRHPKLTLRSPQPLSYCRALCANTDVISDFFGKLGAIYCKLDLLSKPMQIYNADETGISVVHKPGKVLTQLGRHNVYAITSAERGKTHTVLTCVSASGYVLAPMMVYPRKRPVPENVKQGAVPNTLFCHSDNGWINATLYREWFQFFIDNIPPARPVLLIQDGHGSHMSIEVIELARKNQIHVLCLPAHTTHVLQPLDVGVFKSFKSFFSKACTTYLSEFPGRVITPDILASLIADAWPRSLTPVNIMSGFRKCGIYPLNPSAVKDRQTAPSKAVSHKSEVTCTSSPESASLFSLEQETLYRKRFEEGYDLSDPGYVAWMKINHPEVSVSVSGADSVSSSSSIQIPPLVSSPPLPSTANVPLNAPSDSRLQSCVAQSASSAPLQSTTNVPPSDSLPQSASSAPLQSTTNDPLNAPSDSLPSSSIVTESSNSVVSASSSSHVLHEVLVLPKPRTPKRKRKPALNSKAVCITDDSVLQELKDKEIQKAEAQKEAALKKLERERKKKEREERKKEAVERKRERQKKKEKQKRTTKAQTQKKKKTGVTVQVISTSQSEEDNAKCPTCGLEYVDDDNLWICCDGCDRWFDLKCTDCSGESLPEKYFCTECK